MIKKNGGGDMKYLLIFAAVFVLPLAMLLVTRQDKKRGCGRGCATCGNRDICHRRKDAGKRENAQKIQNNFDEIEGC